MAYDVNLELSIRFFVLKW